MKVYFRSIRPFSFRSSKSTPEIETDAIGLAHLHERGSFMIRGPTRKSERRESFFNEVT